MRNSLKPGLCARYLKAMADPDRLRIVQRLGEGPRTVGEIAKSLGAPMANVSHHLKALREMGLVMATKQGRFVIYSLDQRFARSGEGSTLDVLDFGCCRLDLQPTRGAARAPADARPGSDQRRVG